MPSSVSWQRRFALVVQFSSGGMFGDIVELYMLAASSRCRNGLRVKTRQLFKWRLL